MKKTAKKTLKGRLFLAIFTLFFACTSFFSLLSSPTYAVPDTAETDETSEITKKPAETDETSEKSEEKPEKTSETASEEDKEELKKQIENICNNQSGAIGWLICPSSGAISKAIDSIYGTIEEFLVINPIPSDDSSTIHIVWEYIKGFTNIVFIIFLLVVVISHLTGFGLNNYGWKRILPRIIIVGILVNLSFIVCQIAADVSNLLGSGLRGLFTSVEENAILNGTIKNLEISWVDLVDVVTGVATATSIGIALSGGLVAVFWTLVPVLLGAIVSIAIGFITIAMRQALVAVLVMISPLAFVCFLLPNTEKWFDKWKDTLFKMLIFYPAFSFLFGASHLAGWAIINSSVNEAGELSGFGVLLGLAVQVFPLFFSWSLMKMSGTVLGTINQKLHGLASKPLGALNRTSLVNKNYAKSKYLGSKPKGLGQDIMQRINDRQIRKEEDIAKYSAQAKLRGQAYAARMRNKKGGFTKRAADFYELQADSLDYQRQIEQTANDFNKGLGGIMKGQIERGELSAKKLTSSNYARLQNLDIKNVVASDTLKFERARAEQIDYDNAVGFHNRVEQAIDAHIDDIEANNPGHQRNKYLGDDYSTLRLNGRSRYESIMKIMEGDVVGSYYVKADAASNYATQAKIVSSKFQTAFELTPPTQNLENQVRELAALPDSTKHIDQIIAGLRSINMRGDTDIVKKLIDDCVSGGKVQLGTHASQSLANFLMFDVKDNDPMLRRFGKYINLETAHTFNDLKELDHPEKVRKQHTLTFDEYILGEYVETDGSVKKSKRGATKLLEGTSLDNVERTFYSNLDASVRKAYADENGELSEEAKKAFLQKRKEIYNAMGPAFISASLKYPSGSEQLVSAVSYLTGYRESNGKLIKRWEDKDDALYGLDESYFRGCAENYLKDQIPSQILNMRTDYRSALTGHLFSSLMNSDKAEKAKAKKEFARILGLEESLTDYQFEQIASGAEKIEKDDSDNPEIITTNTNPDKRKEIRDYMIDKAGITARKLWDENGTLAQLFKSRRSGAANNAKPFVRSWAGLDNENIIHEYIKKQKKETEKRISENPDIDPAVLFPEEDREAYIASIDGIFEEYDDSAEEFYGEANGYLEESGLNYIAYLFKEYYNNSTNPYAEDLLIHLKELLSDPANYLDKP